MHPNQRVLIIDDNIDTCEMVSLLFSQKGFQTSIAYSGLEALELVQTEEPDIILLDFTMPEMDGMETYEQLRMYTTAPVIFLTAVQSGTLAKEAIEAGVKDYVRKPFYSEELIARVRSQLAQNARSISEVTDDPGSLSYNPVSTSIVIPVYNEEEALPVVLESLQKIVNSSYEVIVVDDGSSDKSAEIASSYPYRFIQHTRNMGKGAALQTGIQASMGRNILFIDADNTYPVEYIPEMVELMESFDLVRGARVLGRSNIPFINRLGNSLFDGVIRALHTVQGTDILSGMYGGNRESLSRLDLESAGFDIEAEINVKATALGLSITTVPITYFERIGDKKLHVLQDGIRILYRVLQLAVTYNPMVTFIAPGILLILAGVIATTWLYFAPEASVGSQLLIYLTAGLANLGAQVIILGLAVYAAGMAYGLRGRANKTLDRLSNLFYDRRLLLFGFVLSAAGLAGLFWFLLTSMREGLPSLQEPQTLVIHSINLILGLQTLISIAFFSALRGLRHKLTSEEGTPESAGQTREQENPSHQHEKKQNETLNGKT